jgi:hypothetical protein
MNENKKNPDSIQRRNFLANCVKLSAGAALIGFGSKSFAVVKDSYLDYGYCIFKCPQPCTYDKNCRGCRAATSGSPLKCTARICVLKKGLASCAHCAELATCKDPYYIKYPGQKTYALSKQNEWGITTNLDNSHRDQTGFSVYPTVANDIITIKNNEKLEVDFNLFDINGRIIKKGKINTDSYLLNVSDLTPGNYIVNIIKDDQLLYLSKIIKK